MKTLIQNRKAFIFVLTLALIFASFTFTFAAYSPDAVGTCTIGVTRVSDTKGETTVAGSLTRIADVCTVTSILQEKNSSGNWVTATGVPATKAVTTSTKSSSFFQDCAWTLAKGKVYRIEVTIEDRLGTSTSSKSYGSNSF